MVVSRWGWLGAAPGLSTMTLGVRIPAPPPYSCRCGSFASQAAPHFYKKHAVSSLYMTKDKIAMGVVHTVPVDLRKMLVFHPDVLEKWNGLTPLARNEWICWTTIVKKAETRAEHIERLRSDLLTGKRRPCCWPGCPHRRPKAKKWLRS